MLVGTNNTHKAGEIAAMLEKTVRGFDSPVSFLLPKDLGIKDEPVEDGETFRDNALIKARFYAARSGLPCLADDSGLEVDALGGRPGVFSSRYAPTDPERIARLLGELRETPEADRSARFVCAAALVVPPEFGREAGAIPDGKERREIVEIGICEGAVAAESRGENGFGYDPVFYLPDLSRTMAEISAGQKNALSHRGRAFGAMSPHLVRLLKEI